MVSPQAKHNVDFDLLMEQVKPNKQDRFPWQREVLYWLTTTSKSGIWAHSRATLIVPRQQGKTDLLCDLMEYWSVVFGERIIYSAQLHKTAASTFERMKRRFDKRFRPDNHALLDPAATSGGISTGNGRWQIALSNGALITFGSRQKNTARGETVDKVVVDEAQHFSREEQEALFPTITSAANPLIMLVGTVPGPKMEGEILTLTRKAALSGKTTTHFLASWEAEPYVDLNDRSVWQRVNPSLGLLGNFNEQFIEDERGVAGEGLSDEGFARERLGIWAHAGTQSVIPMEHWRGLALQPLSAKDAAAIPQVGLGVDISPDASRATLSISYVHPTQNKVVVEVLKTQSGFGWVVSEVQKVIASSPEISSG